MENYIRCLECKKLFKYIIWKHLKQHNLTTEEYKKKYPDAKFVSETSLEKMKKFQQHHNPMKGKKNPALTLLNKSRSGKNHPNYGKSLAEKIKKKISETKKRLFEEGKIKPPWTSRKHTGESKEKNRISHLRENLSKETLEKMSKSHKGILSHRKGLKMEQEYGKEQSKLIKQKQSKSKKGLYTNEKNPNWKKGIKLDPRGYVFVHKPNHPFNNQGYVQEHRLVMEKHIGRYLKPEEEIHHIDGIKNDNRIENLMLLKNSSEHRKLHTGKASSGWKGGLSLEPYPYSVFNEKLKEKIRIRYNRICPLCGIKETELKGYFKKLAIHHVNYIKKDCSEENLIPLCHDCNSKTNSNREYWTNFFLNKKLK